MKRRPYSREPGLVGSGTGAVARRILRSPVSSSRVITRSVRISRKGGSCNASTNAVFGNWELTGILSAQSGRPLNILAGKDRSDTGLGADHAVVTGPARGLGSCGTKAPCVDYLNPDSFGLPAWALLVMWAREACAGPTLSIGTWAFSRTFRSASAGNSSFEPSSSISSGGFGSIQGAGDPRIGQLSLKIFF